MTKKLLLLGILAALLITFITADYSFSQTAPVVSIKANKKSYKAGEQGFLTISFKLKDKVKIPKDPGVELELTSTSVEGIGMQDFSGGDSEYIESNRVKYNFKIPSDVQDQSLTITGNVKFGYCDSNTGVCKKGNKSFSVTVKIKKK